MVMGYDIVIWSTDRTVDSVSPSLDGLISAASPQSPVIAITLPGFDLGKFSSFFDQAGSDEAKSNLISIIRSSKGYATRSTEDTIDFPNPLTISDANEITSSSLTLDESLFLIQSTDWTDAERSVAALLSKLPASYSAIITDGEALAIDSTDREKRQVEKRPQSSDVDFDTAEGQPKKPKTKSGKSRTMARQRDSSARAGPLDGSGKGAIVIPSGDINDTSCRLYLEGMQIYVFFDGSTTSRYVSAPFNMISNDTGTYSYATIDCPKSWWNTTANGTFGPTTFAFEATIPYEPAGMVDKEVYFTVNPTIGLELEIGPRRPGYWGLNHVKITELQIKNVKDSKTGWIPDKDPTGETIPNPMILKDKELTEKELHIMNLGSVMYYSYACGLTKAAFVTLNNKTKDGGTFVAVGIAFKNIQVSFSVDTGKVRTANAGKFDNMVEDCVPTFSPGSLMGILVGLIFASVLMFAFLMLNSVQTMDRFDDPKQKQILINVRE